MSQPAPLVPVQWHNIRWFCTDMQGRHSIKQMVKDPKTQMHTLRLVRRFSTELCEEWQKNHDQASIVCFKTRNFAFQRRENQDPTSIVGFQARQFHLLCCWMITIKPTILVSNADIFNVLLSAMSQSSKHSSFHLHILLLRCKQIWDEMTRKIWKFHKQGSRKLGTPWRGF